MQILWHNIVALILAVLATVVLIRNRTEIAGFLASMRSFAPAHSPEDRVAGLICFGLLLITTVCLAKILTQNNRRDR